MMKTRILVGAAVVLALALLAHPDTARAEPSECSDYVSAGRFYEPWVGTLIGTKTVTLRFGMGSTFWEEQFEVGTYRGRDGEQYLLRCDTYEIYDPY